MPDAPGPHVTAAPVETTAFDALRARGVDRRDPVRFALAEALARRACVHAGAARHLLDERVAVLLEQLSSADSGVVAPVPQRPPPGPLADLVAQAARQKSRPTPAPATTPRDAAVPQACAGIAGDATTLQFFQRTWSRLSADRRLAQSRAALPENAGPLNSQHLVHRSLMLMQALSPDYLERFVGYIDALQWLEQAGETIAAPAPRPPAGRKSLPARR